MVTPDMPKCVRTEQEQLREHFVLLSDAIKQKIRADEISGNGHTQNTNEHINKETQRSERTHTHTLGERGHITNR